MQNSFVNSSPSLMYQQGNNLQFYPNHQINVVNYNYPSYQYQLHPPQQGSFMHNASSFNYAPINIGQNYNINNNIIPPRMNSFNFTDGNSILHNPTNRIQSQNNFYCNLSSQNSISIPIQKKNSSISPSKRKKKGPKKSTADSDSLSISSVLSLTDNELYSYISTQKGSR